MELTKGVIILALNHAYYGNYAIQLLRSIKAVDPSIEVSIAHDSLGVGHLRGGYNSILVPEEYYTNNGLKNYLKAKTFIYELSPYDETIYIDADVIWLPQKPISNLFNEFKDIKFTMSNRGSQMIGDAKEGFIHWASPKLIMEEFKIGPGEMLYNLASEFMYFKKCKEVKKLFNESKKVYEKPPSIFKKFAHGLPDELAFEIALIKCKMAPHKSPFIPFYWEQFEKRSLPVYEMYKNYYGYSLGGNTNTGNVESIYNNLANHYNKKFGVNGYFPARNKRSFLPERQTL